MVFFVLLSRHVICFTIAAKRRRITRYIPRLKQNWIPFLTRAGMARSWSNFAPVLRHDRLELVSTCYLWNAMVCVTSTISIAMQVTVRVGINSINVLVQVVHTVWSSALDCVPQGVHRKFRMWLRPVTTIIMINCSCWEFSRGVLVMALLMLGKWIERGRIMLLDWTWFLWGRLCWLIGWRAWAEWSLLPCGWWLIVIYLRDSGCCSLGTWSRHYATVDRRPHFISHSICQTRHLQRHVWVLRLVVRISHIYQLSSIDVLVIVQRVYSWLLWRETPLDGHLNRIWSLLDPIVWLPYNRIILDKLAELGCWLKFTVA